MEEIILLLVTAGMTGLTEISKKYFPKVNPKLILAILAIIVAGVWSFFSEELIHTLTTKFMIILTGAAGIYNYFIKSLIQQINAKK